MHKVKIFKEVLLPMSIRSMKKTDQGKMRKIEAKNPENKDPQSVLTNAYNESAVKDRKDNQDQ